MSGNLFATKIIDPRRTLVASWPNDSLSHLLLINYSLLKEGAALQGSNAINQKLAFGNKKYWAINAGQRIATCIKREEILLIAAEKGHAELVQSLLSSGVNVLGNELGMKSLYKAVYNCHPNVVKILLNAGVNPNDLFTSNGIKQSLIYLSAYKGDIETMNLLIDAGVDVNIPNINGITALMVAASRGRLDIMAMLLRAGANIHQEDSMGGNTALCYAAKFGNIKSLRFLLEAGADINYHSNIGVSALTSAAGEGQLEAVKFLLEHGAIINGSSQLLILPIIRRHHELIKLLIQYGADVNVRFADGCIPLCIAAGIGNLEIVNLLVNAGADVNAEDKEGRTAIYYAKRGGYQDIVMLLKQRGAKVGISKIRRLYFN